MDESVVAILIILVVIFALFLMAPVIVDWTTWAAGRWHSWYTSYKEYQEERKAIRAYEAEQKLDVKRQADTEACRKPESDEERFKDCMRGKGWVYPGDKGYRGAKP